MWAKFAKQYHFRKKFGEQHVAKINQLSRLFLKLEFELELEFDKLEFQAIYTNTNWNSSLSNSSSKNNLLN